MSGAESQNAVFAAGALRAEFAETLPELAIPWEAMHPENPELVMLNEPLARELGWAPETLRAEAGVRGLLGNTLPEGARPVAQAYAGHQFGTYSARLGDGRALLLGERDDVHGGTRDLHLKGSGRTPFARADGFAALGPMLREYLMGEAMHALGVPTTRALAVIATGRLVPRDGDLQPGAVLVRVASSHLRVGSFQYAAAARDLELLRRLVDFAIARHYPHLAGEANPALRLLEAVIEAQAELIAKWMLLGFVHGVMNTDNMTVSGETIDYGPCAFLDSYDPFAKFSSIDHGGRYAYGAQPRIGLWNITRLAEALLPLIGEDAEEGKRLAIDALEGFMPAYDRAWGRGMRAKLGITGSPQGAEPGDNPAIGIAAGLLAELDRHRIDYTRAFSALTLAAAGRRSDLQALYPDGAAPGEWFALWSAQRADVAAMRSANPIRIPRNHLVDEALAAASEEGDLALFKRLLAAVTAPFDELPADVPDRDRYAEPDPSGRRFVSFCGT